MKKLKPYKTAQERNRIYREMLSLLLANTTYTTTQYPDNRIMPTAFCSILRHVKPYSEIRIKQLPELYASRPRKLDLDYWWKRDDEGTSSRTQALLIAIAATEK